MRRFIESHFSLLMLLSCVAGLFVPGFGSVPNQVAIWILAALMFMAAYQIRTDHLAALPWRRVLLFHVLRYIALPMLLWIAGTRLWPDYATGVFLLAAVPAAVSSPAISALYGGNVAVSFGIVILSQLATPLSIPLLFAWAGSQGAPKPEALFATMLLCILLPLVLHLAVRRHKPTAAFFLHNGKSLSILLIAFIIGLAVAKQSDIILEQFGHLGGMLAMALASFALYMAFGRWFSRRTEPQERISYIVCSGFNNAALGVSLALLHFTPPVVLFFAVSEIAWSLLPVMLKGFLPSNKYLRE